MSAVVLFRRIAFGALAVGASAAVALVSDRVVDRDGGDFATLFSDDAHVRAPVTYEGADPGVGKVDLSRIESASVVTHVEVVAGDVSPKIVLLDPDGNVVYESDPATNTTVLAKDVIIPSVTVREDPDAIAELRVVTAAPPVRAPVELQEALTAELTEPAGMFYREDL